MMVIISSTLRWRTTGSVNRVGAITFLCVSLPFLPHPSSQLSVSSRSRVARAGIELLVKLSMTMTVNSCLPLQSGGVTDVHSHSWYMRSWESSAGLCAS